MDPPPPPPPPPPPQSELEPAWIRPILLAVLANSVNQSAPSGPVTMSLGSLAGCGTVKAVKPPQVVSRPIRLPSSSVSHSAPSGPNVMPDGLAPVGNSASLAPLSEICSTVLVKCFVNQSEAPEAAIPAGSVLGPLELHDALGGVGDSLRGVEHADPTWKLFREPQSVVRPERDVGRIPVALGSG